ncbi:DsbA family protein [Stappia sp. MMSF_3263]|uniref:DsbA family protein n=1 Tax=Stappia sp. MMSF_3263 TaxID=3046693 RepID=UPI00273D2462|nr:DsbA family protein [Stappia sp. MMSF_3263]
METGSTMHLDYIFDPLCGWCYGALPAMEQAGRHPEIAVELVPSGLFAGGGAFPMNDGFAAHAWEADQRIARLSGQPFSEAYRANVLGARGTRVDSGPATLALTAVRLTAPERELEALSAIQRVRYVAGRDNADPAILSDVLQEMGLDEAARRFAAPDEALVQANAARIEAGRTEMARFGVRGVPALVAGRGEARRLIGTDALYGGLETLLARLRGV